MARDAAAGPSQPRPASLAGLDLLPTAVVVLDEAFVVRYANPAAESLLDTASRALVGQPFLPMFAEFSELEQTVREALSTQWNYSAQNVNFLRPAREPLQLGCFVTRTESPDAPLLVELRPIEQMLRISDRGTAVPGGGVPAGASKSSSADASRMWRSTFSTTTIASSTTIPIANTMPNSVMVLMENPRT